MCYTHVYYNPSSYADNIHPGRLSAYKEYCLCQRERERTRGYKRARASCFWHHQLRGSFYEGLQKRTERNLSHLCAWPMAKMEPPLHIPLPGSGDKYVHIFPVCGSGTRLTSHPAAAPACDLWGWLRGQHGGLICLILGGIQVWI